MTEKYELTWVGKKNAIANCYVNNGTIVPLDFITAKNHLNINGENLTVLKMMQQNYTDKVKMIYIDPPYNTGKKFIYNDKFSSRKDLDKHSTWLSMMYPRLYLARNLLRDDGVIFISIDDNEAANLKLLCDEVFGAENFVCQFVWQTKKGAQGMTTKHMVVPNCEVIFTYAKNANYFTFLGTERSEDGFSNPDNDPRGLWKRQYLQRLGQGLSIRTIVDPVSKMSFSFETPYTQDKLDNWIKEGRILFPKNGDSYPARKEFLKEYENKQQLVTNLGLFATKSTTEKLYGLFDGCKIFTNPKPDNLIDFLMRVVESSGIILDFFAGSGTTAQAVMELNLEDGGNRQCICVQMPEILDESSEAYKAGYRTIADITRARIDKVIAKLKTEQPDKTTDLACDHIVIK